MFDQHAVHNYLRHASASALKQEPLKFMCNAALVPLAIGLRYSTEVSGAGVGAGQGVAAELRPTVTTLAVWDPGSPPKAPEIAISGRFRT